MTTGRSARGRRAIRPRIPVLAAVLCLASVFRTDPARAQFQSGEWDRREEKKAEGCAETVTRPLPVENGIAQVRIVSSCRQGQTLAIQTDEAVFEAVFDQSGVLRAQVPIFRDPTILRWPRPDGRRHEEQVRFANVQQVLRIALIWKGDLTLSLRVNEALAPLPGASCPWFRRGDTCRGLGRFEILQPEGGPGTYAEIYTLQRLDVLRQGLLTYRVSFDSQTSGGGAANAAYCGRGQWAEPTFQVWILKNGTLSRDRRLSGFRGVPCDAVRQEARSSEKSDIPLEP